MNLFDYTDQRYVWRSKVEALNPKKHSTVQYNGLKRRCSVHVLTLFSLQRGWNNEEGHLARNPSRNKQSQTHFKAGRRIHKTSVRSSARVLLEVWKLRFTRRIGQGGVEDGEVDESVGRQEEVGDDGSDDVQLR